jgi:hypothetical protein
MDERSSIRPMHALLSPAWLLALALLLANDHWLKYADLAPGWLTGKLSDLAGMLVAPVLLAVLLRVRRRDALLACHVAVGLVFTAIKLSPACAGWWSWSMGLLGYPWTIVVDPTDLLALPCLLLSWKLLLPHMDPAVSPLVPLQRSAVAGLTVLGLWSSVATTEGPEPWVSTPFYQDVSGQLYLHNASDVTIAFHVRPLREDIRVDCDEVAIDPGRLLSPEAFGDAQHWLLDPGVNIGLEFVGNGCGAFWVAGEGIEPTIFFIDFEDYPVRWWPGFHEDGEALFEEGLAIDLGGEQGLAAWTGIDDVRFTPRTDSPEQPQACEPSPAESRIDWSDELPAFPVRIAALDAGLDGCFEFMLEEYGLSNAGAVVPSGDSYTWYLCAPAAAMPFVLGDFIDFEFNSGDQGTRELTLTLLDPLDLQPALGGSGVPLRRLRLLHGGTGPQFIGAAVERELVAVVDDACPWQLEPGCATAERAVQLHEVGSTEQILVGTPVMFSSSLVVRTMVLSHMRERAVVDQACSDGALILVYDIDLALVEEPG